MNNYSKKCVFGSEVWFNIGKLLYRIFDGDEEGYNIWEMFSAFDKKNFDSITCYETWVVFSPDWDFSYDDYSWGIVKEDNEDEDVEDIPDDY